MTTSEFEAGYPTETCAHAVLAEVRRRRAVEAYRFFYPTVSLEGIFQGARDVGVVDNEGTLMIEARPHHVGFTLNSDTPYAGGPFDLRTFGPLVIEVPSGPLVGLVDDHHHRWLTDVGLPGVFGADGGRHLVLPPGWDGEVPDDGYDVVRSDTWTVFCPIRALPVGGDMDKAKRLLSSVRFRPLHGDAPEYEFIDWTAKPVDCSCLRWEDNLEFWRVLHTVIDSEPPIDEMRPMLGMLAELGIEAGKPFDPTPAIAQLLTDAARQGRDEMLVSAFASDRPDRITWPDRKWEWAGLRPENGTFERAGSLDVEAKDRWFAQAIVTSPAMFRRAVGQGSLYWLGLRDANGDYLDGGRSYTLTVPLPVPAMLFWSVTAYDAATRSEVTADQDRAALRSLIEDIAPDGADSVDLHFGPNPPAEGRDRWIQTVPGRGWFTYFRIYGPEQPAFDGTWKPGDFRQV